MNSKLYTKKGLTFKGAFVVVIFVHIVGICSLLGYTKYRSNQLRLAREEWKNKIEQRHNTDQNEWKTNSMSSPKIVARPQPKTPTKFIEQNNHVSVFLEKTQDLTKTVLAKARTEIDSALKDSNKKEKIQIATTFLSSKKKPEIQKTKAPPISKVTIVPPITQPTTQTIYTEIRRSTASPKKPIYTSSRHQPTSRPIANQSRYVQTRTDPRLKTHTEYDYETQETVQTFYSY